MEESKKFNYFAFISYRGADVEIAKKLQRKFYKFKLPSTYVNPFDPTSRIMKPVCRDRDNFVGGEVLAQIKEAIDHSMYVVLVCTPNMTRNDDQTHYVNDEIQHLIDTDRMKYLIPLVFDGRVYSPDDYRKAGRSVEEPFDDDCLPYALRKWMASQVNHDFTLNIFNIEEQGERDEEKMFLRCVATILAEEFSKLWDRFKIEQKKRKKRMILGMACAACVVASIVIAAVAITQPKDVFVKLNEYSVYNENLPDLKDAVVTITIDDYVNFDTIARIEDLAVLDKVPYGYLDKNVHLTFNCKHWMSLDTIVPLKQKMTIDVCRDSCAYGDIYFRLWNEEKGVASPNTIISINGHEVTSDSDGCVKYFMPLVEQDTCYMLNASLPLEENKLYMPTTESTVIIVK